MGHKSLSMDIVAPYLIVTQTSVVTSHERNDFHVFALHVFHCIGSCSYLPIAIVEIHHILITGSSLLFTPVSNPLTLYCDYFDCSSIHRNVSQLLGNNRFWHHTTMTPSAVHKRCTLGKSIDVMWCTKDWFKMNVLKSHFSQVWHYTDRIWWYLQTMISWEHVVKVASKFKIIFK